MVYSPPARRDREATPTDIGRADVLSNKIYPSWYATLLRRLSASVSQRMQGYHLVGASAPAVFRTLVDETDRETTALDSCFGRGAGPRKHRARER